MTAPATPRPLQRLALTPEGARHAFSRAQPDDERLALQQVLAATTLPAPEDWLQQGPDRAALLGRATAAGWLHTLQRELKAPDMRLDDFLPQVIAGLSGERRAALSSDGGFCVAHAGYSAAEAEALCVAAADFSEFAQRQRGRGWQGASDMVSFHTEVAMLIPSVSFAPFWVDGIDYCLVLGGEPLLNNPAFVELVWGLKSSGLRFTAPAAAIKA